MRIDSIVADYSTVINRPSKRDLQLDSMTMDDLRTQVSDYLFTSKMQEKIVQGVPSPTQEEVAAYYEENQTGYLTERSVEARHILVAVGDRVISGDATTTTTDFSDTEWAQALATAAQVRVQLLTGGSWSLLAAQYSDYGPTKNDGGYLGTVSQGDLVAKLGQEFENVLFTLDLDRISEPVKTADGYHLIQVTKVNEPRQKTLEEAQADITASLVSQGQAQAWLTWIESAKLEVGVIYRDDMRPTTTTVQPATTSTTKP